MKKIWVGIACSLLLLTGCSTTPEKKNIELTSIATAFTKMDKKESFFLLTSKASCTHCDDLKEMLKETAKDHETIIYNIVIDESNDENYAKAKKQLEKRLDKPARTPHVYFIKNGEVVDEYVGYTKGDDDKFWNWIETQNMNNKEE